MLDKVLRVKIFSEKDFLDRKNLERNYLRP